MKGLFRKCKEWIIYIWHRYILRDLHTIYLADEFKINEILMLSPYNNVRSLVVWVKEYQGIYLHYLRNIR